MNLRPFLSVPRPVFLVLLVLSGTLQAQQKKDPERVALLKAVDKALAEQDSFVAVEAVLAQGEPRKIMARFFHMTQDLYWENKNLAGAVILGRAGIQYGVTKLSEFAKDNPDQGKWFATVAQMIANNLASFAWPGWDEKGIAIGEAELAMAVDMARTSLRLCVTLKMEPIKISNAHWQLGAAQLAAKQHDAARASFEAARAEAEKVKAADHIWMCTGYAALVDVVSRKDVTGGDKRFREAIAELTALKSDDATFFATQLKDVRKVFEKR